MSKQSKGINSVRIPWLMYPLNKANSYSYDDGRPIVRIQFAQNASRVMRSKSVFLNGKMRIQSKVGTGANRTRQLPANRFDLTGSAGSTTPLANEQVAYIDHLTSIHGMMETVSISDMVGSTVEEAGRYNRQMASQLSAMNSYRNPCSYGNMSLASCPNNDVIARECSSEIEFSIPLNGCGYMQSNSLIPLEKGFELRLNLANDAKVLYGLSAQKFTFSFRDLFLSGDMMELAQPMTGLNMDYSSFHDNLVTLTANNDYQNIPLNLSRVNKIFQNFQATDWAESFNYNSYATSPILNKTANLDDYVVAPIEQYNINRAQVRYPNNFLVDEKVANKNGSFQAVRSRMYLDGITPFWNNKSCLISPVTEALDQMVAPRTDWLKTPQAPDGGLVRQWKKDATGKWTRDGPVESTGYCYGISCNLDMLGVGQWSNYKIASYNWNIQSTLGVNAPQNPTNVYVYALARIHLQTMKNGQTVALK